MVAQPLFQSQNDVAIDLPVIANLAGDLVAWLGAITPTEAIPALVDALLDQLEKLPAQGRVIAFDRIAAVLRQALEHRQ